MVALLTLKFPFLLRFLSYTDTKIACQALYRSETKQIKRILKCFYSTASSQQLYLGQHETGCFRDRVVVDKLTICARTSD